MQVDLHGVFKQEARKQDRFSACDSDKAGYEEELLGPPLRTFSGTFPPIPNLSVT